MKANELQIGDWVHVKSPSSSADSHDDIVVYLDKTELGTRYYSGSYTFIRPISLTPEVLEMNSIKKRGDEYVVFGWDGAKQWSVALEDFKPQFDFWFIASHDRDLNVRGKIRYVHELQHALRLCGLNEMADNFKVE